MLCSLGKIEQKELDEIKSLERELGKTILAFKCSGDTKPAELTDQELDKIRDAERRLGLTLVAVAY